MNEVREKDSRVDELAAKLNAVTRERNELKRELRALQNQFDHYYFSYSHIVNSLSWKITSPLRFIKRIFFLNLSQFRKLVGLLIRGKWDVVYLKIKSRLMNLFMSPPGVEEFRELLSSSNKIIVFHPLVDWKLPLFQRPQHIAISLAQEGYQYVYCTPGVYDGLQRNFKPIGNLPLYVTSYGWVIEEFCKNHDASQLVMHVYAQDPKITVDDITYWQSQGRTVLYEYIDAITDELSVSREEILERHEYVLRDEKCVVVTTARNLFNEVASYRSENFQLITNGVEYEHFADPKDTRIPREISDWVESKKTIVGYFGAIASWFDFESVKWVAENRPEWNILLLGWDYDGTLTKHPEFSTYSNIRVLGPIEYESLPRYARHFSVATIPFQINEITEATNPIKMFEYMALAKPIVASDLPECRNYPVVKRYSGPEDFAVRIEEALTLQSDTQYMEELKKTALLNTWQEKGKDMSSLICKAIERDAGQV